MFRCDTRWISRRYPPGIIGEKNKNDTRNFEKEEEKFAIFPIWAFLLYKMACEFSFILFK
jgi:hypothetical protein